MIGWIKLHRTLKDWEWYSDINATRVLVHLLLSVNYEDKKWMGVTIKAGSIAIGRFKFAEEIGLSPQQTRTALKKLESSGEVTSKSTNKFTVITLVKWDSLQSLEVLSNKQNNKRITNEQQTDNKRITTTKEDNNIINKEDKNNIHKKVKTFSEDVLVCYNLIVDFFPEHLHPKNNKSWLDTIEKLNRIDKIPFQSIIDITKKTRSDNFWASNFLSLNKLRKKNKDGIMYVVVFNEKIKSQIKQKPKDAAQILQERHGF